jgi:peptide/nickel transport system substrate-binding protein
VDEQSDSSWKRFRKLKPSSTGIRTNARKLESATLKHAHTFVLSRFDSIRFVKRHALGWLLFVGLLISVSAFQLIGYQRSYSTYASTAGGTFAEGVVGPLETMNPIFARTSAEQSASRLLFSSLLSYDSTTHLRGEIADSWRAEDAGRRYVVDLKRDVYWHDGEKVTADDVVYTINMIKNPLVRSPLYSSWSQVKVTKISDLSVQFDLVRTYAAFPHALTFGILPKHILGSTAPERLRESEFNRQPVGSGAFVFNRLQVIDPDEGRSIVYMEQNPTYIRGTPKLDRFQLHIFKDSPAIQQAFIRQEINAGVDLTSAELKNISDERSTSIIYKTLISDGMYAFMRNDAPEFSDPAVRKAFVLGTDRAALIDRLHGYASRLDGPLTLHQLPSALQRRQPAFDNTQAAALLEQAGWKLDGQKRVKDGVPLEIDLVSVQSGDYPVILDELKQQWERLGATVNTRLVNPNDVQQTVLLPRNYDAFVYELELGADPDVFAYWHLSQADPRGLNLSNYKSAIASEALSSAQLRLEMSARLPKYELFTDVWIADSPAVALYQPQIHYVTSADTQMLTASNTLANRTDRYRSVELWTVDKDWVYNSP